MKTNLYIVLAVLLLSCKDEQPLIEQHAPIIQTEITAINSVEFNKEVTVAGTASSKNFVRDISFFLVKKEGDTYERLWFSPLQYADMTISETVQFEANVRIDDPEANAIAIVASDPYGFSTTQYVTIGEIVGSPQGSAYVLKDIDLFAEYEYGDQMPYVFSLTGVKVGEEVKHVVRLDEIKATKARNLDFALTNVWRNSTTFTAGVLTDWGFTLCEFRQLARGPVGRQCDYITLTGNSNIPDNTDTCCLALVSNAVSNSLNLEQVLEHANDNFGTSNFLNALEVLFESNAINSQYKVSFKTAASGVNTTACKSNVGVGSFIAFRKTKNKVHSYGLPVFNIQDAKLQLFKELDNPDKIRLYQQTEYHRLGQTEVSGSEVYYKLLSKTQHQTRSGQNKETKR